MESIAALFVERLLDVFAMVALATLTALDHPAYRPLVLISFIIVVAAICGAWLTSSARLIDRLRVISARRLYRIFVPTLNLFHASQSLLRPSLIISGTAIGLIAWGAEGLGFGVICHDLHISGTAWSFCGIYAVAVLAGSAAFFLPAGIGSMEIVMSGMLVERGAPLRIAIVATLLCRLATLWFAVLVGIAAASFVEVTQQKQSPQVMN